MTTTIQQAFNQFRQNLEITGLQSTTVSTRQQNVRAVMQAGLNVSDSLSTGCKDARWNRMHHYRIRATKLVAAQRYQSGYRES